MSVNKYKKKGFSLIELLVVIAIISCILLIAFNSVLSSILKSKETSYSLTVSSILDSSVAYVMEFSRKIDNWKYELDDEGVPDVNSKYYCVTVGELINQGYFSDSILNDTIKINTYVKVTHDEKNGTYSTSGLLNSDSSVDATSLCEEYVITFLDKDGAIINIDGEDAQITVSSGYVLVSGDFPSITSSTSYYSFTEGSSTFVYNGKWKNEDGTVVTAGTTVNRDLVLTISYSLESGYGDAYLLVKGQQRPFLGESDDSSRYSKGADIVLTDNGGTSLADFVLNCEDTHNCVLSLERDEIDNYLTLETKESLSKLETNENEIDWYVLKYVDGTWHLDGQITSDINVGFISLSRLSTDTYANCKYIGRSDSCNYSDGYNLAFSCDDSTITINSVTVNYSNGNKSTYSDDSLEVVSNDYTILSTGYGYYTSSKITPSNAKSISSVIINYEKDDQSYTVKYTYSYNSGIYIFKLN